MNESLAKFVKDSGWSFAALLVTAIAQFVLRVILGRFYGAADLGLYTLAITVYSFGLVIASFGIDMGLIKYVAEAIKLEKDDRLFLMSGNIASFLIGCLMTVLLFMTAPFIAEHFFKMPNLSDLLKIVAVVFPFLGLEKSIFGYLTGVRKIQVLAWLTIAQSFLTILLTIAAAYLGLSVEYTVWSFVLPIMLVSLVSILFVRRSIIWFGFRSLISATKTLLKFGSYIVLANGLGVIQVYTGTMLIGYFMTDADVGLYSVASTIIQAFFLAPSAVQRITSALFAGYWAKREINRIERLVNLCMKYGALYGVIMALVTFLLSRELIGVLFGQSLLGAALPLQILLISASVGAIYSPIGGILSNTDFVKIVFRITGVTVIVNLLFNVILIPTLGLAGSAIASAATTIVFVATQLYFAQRLTKIKIDWGWFARLLGISILLVIGTWLLGRIITHIGATIVGLAIFVVVMLKWFLTAEDRRIIRGVVRIPILSNHR